MQCPRCHEENREGRRFCAKCAAPLAVPCPSCGFSNEPGEKFCGGCGQPLSGSEDRATRALSPESYTPKHLAEKILTSKAALEGERKQVTVLFADLKGSMELLADRDPEEARKLLDPVLEHMMEAVHRYEGTVNQVMGDGIMALFGAPLTHEDHAMRACYAALRMQESVARYSDEVFCSQGVRIQIRIGLNSGEVVVRAIGSDLHMDYTAVGQTTHMAARMEQMATPGTILLTAGTLRLVEGVMRVQPLGAMGVKGVTAPVEVYNLVAANPVLSRLQAAAARGLTTFVGREPEMDALLASLEQAKAKRGQVVAVVGEPGVGKTRLFWELTHSDRMQDCLVLEAASVSHGKGATYLPVVDLIKGYFRIEERDDTRKIREKVTGKLLLLDRVLERCLAPLLWLLDVPAEDREWDRLDPALRRQRLLDSVRRVLMRESQVQPLVVVFEDLHWIDSETQALLDSLVEGLPAAQLLLLVSYRPEYIHGWGSKTYYRQLRLDPLASDSADHLLGTLLGDHPSVAALRPALIDRTDGNPFFLEESVRSFVEAGALHGERGAYRLVKAAESMVIPATVQMILAARIDRLTPDGKRLLQTASVIGKNVPLPLLQVISEMDEPTLQAGLGQLQAAEFLYEVQLFPESEFSFKHALTHEATYGTLLRDRRRMLHARIVEAIEHFHRGRLDEQIEQLAHHAKLGELWDKAAAYAHQAAVRALARNAYRQAATHFEGALRAVSNLPQTRDTQALSIDLMLVLRGVFVPLGEPRRSLEVAERVVTFAESLGESARLANAFTQLVNARYIAGHAAGAAALEQRVLSLVAAAGDPARQFEARTYLGQALIALGEYHRAVALLERNLEAPEGKTLKLTSRVATPVLSDAYLAWGLAEVGNFARAVAIAETGARLAATADTNTVYTRLCALFGLSVPALLQGGYAAAIPHLEEGLALARGANLLGWLPAFAGGLGYAKGCTGLVEAGLNHLGEAIRYAEATVPCHQGVYLSWQSEILRLGGRCGEAWSVALQGLEGARRRGERGDEVRCLVALAGADGAAVSPAAESAESHLHEALTLASELGMRPLVAHCHVGLGKVYRGTGKRKQAQEHLTTATTMYREMDMRFWLEQAEAEMTALR